MRLSVALVQLDATGDVEANIDRATALADEAAAGGARLVVLPEYLHYRGDDDGFRASARPIPGPFTEAFAEVARRHKAWILAGSVAETSDDPGCPYKRLDRGDVPQDPPLRRVGRRRSGRYRVSPRLARRHARRC